MAVALDWSRCCPIVADRFNVGAVIAVGDQMLAHGYSRETDAHVHAEESALAKLPGVDLVGATLYTTMEPCSIRHSRPRTCTQLIIDAGIRRVAYAILEPPLLVDCDGIELLQAAGITVIHTPQYSADVITVNKQLQWPAESR
jgi:diaminohydroxyphosphoribosylaminopyrimidine deaminase / 5-amino-6-(5-phosphoribosylamino)uracil reductase